ncbi:MAG: hypothetical protein ACFCVF_14170 [Kineosporiaceae bacterium]
MSNPLLSSYRAGENRVTSSTMAVFERIDLAVVRDLLAAASGSGDELEAVTFENQVSGDASIPDARISGRFTWLFETKTERGAYASEGRGREQLRGHGRMIGNDPDTRLFVLTPDPVQPEWLSVLDGIDESARSRVAWIGFRQLADAIDELTRDPRRLIDEQSRFLLGELVRLYETDGLLSFDDTVVVAARAAWPEYQRISAYVCQPKRKFRDGLTHFGFYADGCIQPLIPLIERHEVAVPFTAEEAARREDAGDDRVASLIWTLMAESSRTVGDQYDVILLTGPHDSATVSLAQPIRNDTVSAAGRPWAWTLGQRYTQLTRLQAGLTHTSQL